jgi:hypothetical protein
LAASTGPEDRPITDPKSVTSASNSAARPAPIDDLYYTRSVSGASWSHDGQQIVFTSDIAGRSNLWKVRASRGWPLQLTQSDDRHFVGMHLRFEPDGVRRLRQGRYRGARIGKVGDLASAKGENLDKSKIAELFLTYGKNSGLHRGRVEQILAAPAARVH